MRKVLATLIYSLFFFQTEGLGQLLRFDEVTQLNSSINSEAEESLPLITNDGNTLYFVRSFYRHNKGGEFAGQDIWVSEKEGDEWAAPSNQLGILNNKKNNAVIGVGSEGKTLFLLDTYGASSNGIAFSRYFKNKWTKPESIPIRGIAKDGFKGFYMNPSFTVLLISMNGPNSLGKEDLYVCVKDSLNVWSNPINLGATINSAGFEISPFLTPDGSHIIFASNGHPGFGDADLFISKRLFDSWTVWSTPKNLGPVINSSNYDAYLSIDNDSTVVFSSNRLSENADLFKSAILSEEIISATDQADMLHNEADALLSELRKLSGRNIVEKIVFFDYNQFVLNDDGLNTLTEILANISDIKEYTFSIEAFSFEGYDKSQQTNINSRRINTIKDYLNKKGAEMADIKEVSFKKDSMKKLESTRTGGVLIELRKKLSY